MTNKQYELKKEQLNELELYWLTCDFDELDWTEKRIEKLENEIKEYEWELNFYKENWA